jgi:hypothetical protein
MADLPTNPDLLELGGLVAWAGDMGEEVGLIINFEYKYRKEGAWILWSGATVPTWSPSESLTTVRRRDCS